MNRFHSYLARLLAGAGALALANLAFGAAHAQVICEKVSKPGKFKIRDACKDGKESQIVDLAALITLEDVAEPPRTFVFGSLGSFETIDSNAEFLPLDGSERSFSFETTGDVTDLAITFASECTLNSTLAEVELTVFLDGAKIVPHDSGDETRFCAAWSTDLIGHTHSLSTVVEGVAAGVHTLQVQVRTTGGAGILDDTTVTIVASER